MKNASDVSVCALPFLLWKGPVSQFVSPDSARIIHSFILYLGGFLIPRCYEQMPMAVCCFFLLLIVEGDWFLDYLSLVSSTMPMNQS